jgi:hypothetical protein
MPRMNGRRAAVTAFAVATFGLAGTAAASVQQLPPGGQVNDDAAAGIDPARDAGASDVVGGSLAAGGVRVPWAAFEQTTPGAQQIFVRAFKGGAWKTQGRSLNIDPNEKAEAPSIDFAGAGRTVPWTAWYEPNQHLGDGTPTNIFASRFDQTAKEWVPEGQDRAPAFKVPSLNIHTDQAAENPSVAGGAAVAGAAPVPWVAWQEEDGAKAGSPDATDQIFVSRGIKQTDCSANMPGGGTSVSQFCWQQVGLGRLAAESHDPGADPTLSVDPTRDAVEPDVAFTGPSDTVPWVVWYEQGSSKLPGLAGNELVFAAKAVSDGGGKFHWVVVGNRASSTLDNSGTNHFGASLESAGAERDSSLNAFPDRDAEDPRVASGTLVPGNPTSPWVAWAEDTGHGKKGIFVSRLVGGTHFELANGGLPVSGNGADASDPDITFSGNTPYVTWHEGGNVVTGHFTSATAFQVDTRVPDSGGGRSPISSSDTADPFTADGATPPSGTTGTPFFLTLTEGSPHRLLAHGYSPDDVRTLPASAVSDTGAHIAGSVNPAGAAVKVHLEFGPTTAYGSRTADQIVPAGNAPVTFGADLTGLPEDSELHYRAVVNTDFGTFTGADATLTTGDGQGQGGNGQGGNGNGHHRHQLRIVSKRSWMDHHGNVRITLSSPAGADHHGVLRLRARGMTLGSAHFTLRAGHSRKVRVHLSARGQRLLRSSHRLKAVASAGGVSRTLTLGLSH